MPTGHVSREKCSRDFLSEEGKGLPITQKAVVNSIVNDGLSKDPDGLQVMHTDNGYSGAESAVMLRTQHDILINGTTWTNLKGWE